MRTTECLGEDELFELAHGERRLADAPVLESHLADCPSCSALLSTLLDGARDRRDRTGTTLGPYRLDGLLGAGAMGEVYRGWDARLQRAVAVKVLSAQFAESADRVRRLAIEARAAAAIAHPNVVTVYDTGDCDGVPYVVRELIAGEALRSRIDRGALPRRRALELGLQLARGLAAAHAQGVVHRDLKPTNLIVTDDGTLKILDFGLAKVEGDRGADATEPGTLVGTSGYLSPEQARGEPTDARSDLFAAGAILYELLTGTRAFGGATFAERLSAVLRDTPPILDDPASDVVMRCLDKDPRKRFQSAADLAWVLQRAIDEAAREDRSSDGGGRGDRIDHGDGVDRDGLGREAGFGRDDGNSRDGNGRRDRGGAERTRTSVGASPQREASSKPRRGVSRRTFLVGAAATGIAGMALDRALRPAQRRAFTPEYRQLTFRQGRVASARFTRDGGSLLYSAAWEDHPTSVFTARLGGGGTRPLELPPAELLAVSSRGELALSLDHRFVDGFFQRGQLALAPLEGGTPRGVGVEVQHADFTPDGSELAIVRRVGGRFRLELPIGRVLVEHGWISHPHVSPDGTAVACCLHDEPFDDRGDLVIVGRDGRTPRAVAEDWSSIDGLAWAADGRALWVSASREGGNNSIYAIGLDGRELAHVPAAGRLRMHDMSPRGLAALSHVTGRMRMMVRAPGASDEVDLAQSDIAMACDLSADGRQVSFVEFGDVDTARGGYVRATDGGPALRLGECMPLDLADDGRSVLVKLYDPPGIAIAPIPEGQMQRVPIGLARVKWARWASGDRLVVAGAMGQGEPPRLWRRNRDGTLVPLTELRVAPQALVDPRGDACALVVGDRLVVIDIDTGRARAIAGEYSDRTVCGWSADATAVYVRTKSPPTLRVDRVALADGARTFVRDISPPRVGLRGVDTLFVSADANAYAYSYGQQLSRLYTMTTDDPA